METSPGFDNEQALAHLVRCGRACGDTCFVPALNSGKLTCMCSISGFPGPSGFRLGLVNREYRQKIRGREESKVKMSILFSSLEVSHCGLAAILIKAKTPVGWSSTHTTLADPSPCRPRVVTASCCYLPLGCYTSFFFFLLPPILSASL